MKTKNLNLLTVAALLTGLAANAQTTADITTSDGRTYHSAEILRADPDGIIINYSPEQPGIGMAKIKFANLPDSFRSKYAYDADKSSSFEKDQAQAAAQWRSQRSVTDETIARYRAVAELNRSLAGDDLTSYSVSLGADGKISAQGFTGSYPPYSYFNPWQNYSSMNPQAGGASQTNMNRGFGY